MKTVLLFFTLMMIYFFSFGQESGYINLPNGCQIWMKDRPQKVEWTGHCTNGYASGFGTKNVYEDNKLSSEYVGNLVNAKRDEKGKIPCTDIIRMKYKMALGRMTKDWEQVL